MNNQNIKIIIVALVVFVMSLLASYIFFGRSATPAQESARPAHPEASRTSTGTGSTAQDQEQGAPVNGSDSFFAEIFGADETSSEARRNKDWSTILSRVMVRLTLAALLTSILAFRPRRFSVLFNRNLFVAQTQILLAVVGSALMMIVGDSAARAFGIFAAVSLVRFRTNIKDPKEVTVLLVSLAIGLATGVGRSELAAFLSLFVLILLWVLEYREPELVSRAMELKVRTRSLVETYEILSGIIKKHGFSSEIRAMNREDEKDPFGCVVFCLEMGPLVSTDELSGEIFAADRDNVDSIEWIQPKSSANVYQ
jgi:uncharacterized membrane protein YhiD involved in acid resistance